MQDSSFNTWRRKRNIPCETRWYVLNPCYVIVSTSKYLGDRSTGVRLSMRANLETLRRVEKIRDVGGKLSIRTVIRTVKAVLKVLKEESCMTRMSFFAYVDYI